MFDIEVKYNKLWRFFGCIFLPITFFFYSTFFERKHYLIRKELLKYLRIWELEKPKHILKIPCYEWELPKDITLLYWINTNSCSLHDKNKKCILSGFNKGKLDERNNKKILTILKKAINKYELGKINGKN